MILTRWGDFDATVIILGYIEIDGKRWLSLSKQISIFWDENILFRRLSIGANNMQLPNHSSYQKTSSSLLANLHHMKRKCIFGYES